MYTFIIGLLLLIVGGYFYSKYCVHIFEPDDRETPATALRNDVDFVPISKHKNAFIQLLNIAGTGPILGPILGIMFGPIAFILIPIGNVLGGAVHDYFCGVISMRNHGAQMPTLVKKYLGKGVYKIYNVFLCLTLLLVGTVFIYTPGDIFVAQVMQTRPVSTEPLLWIVYAVIFTYYIIATMFPIDKIIGKIYPIFGFLLLASSVAIFVGIFAFDYPLQELSWNNWTGLYPNGQPLIPMFFVTVACGIVSGFHASQSTLLSRTVMSEHDARLVFYGMMVLEGVIAMIWSAAAMGLYTKGIDAAMVGTPAVVGLIADDMLGTIGGTIAVIGFIILPISSGDTALRSMRLILAETLNVDQRSKLKRLLLSLLIFVCAGVMLFYSRLDTQGFAKLWHYFAWSNQTVAVFSFTIASVYLIRKHKPFALSFFPGTFYMFVVSSYILHEKIGFGLPWNISYTLATIMTLFYTIYLLKLHHKMNIKDS